MKHILHATFLLTALLLALCFAFSGPVSAGTAHAPAWAVALGQGLAQAQTLLDQGKAEEAYALYMRLLRQEPGDAAINAGLYRAALAAGRANQALAALERLVDLRPDDGPLRLELVRLYSRVGDSANARQELPLVRQRHPGLNPEQAETFLRDLKRKNSRFQYAGRLSAGVVYDSNANAGLHSRAVNLGGLDLLLDSEAGRKEAWGEYFNAAVNGAYRVSPSSSWWLVGDAAFYGKVYNRDLPSNQTFGWGRLAVGARRVGPDSMLDLRVKAEHAVYDPYEAVTLAGPELTFAYALADWLQLVSQGSLERRDYITETGRDGLYWQAGEYLRFLWNGAGKEQSYSLLVGGRLLGSGTDRQSYGYDGWEALARLNLRLTEHLELTPFGAYRQLLYHEPATRLEKVLGVENRLDRAWQTGLFVTWHWTKNLATDLGWQYLHNDSTSPLYRYEQHMVNMGLTWSF